jgi:hypothetical protein
LQNVDFSFQGTFLFDKFGMFFWNFL